MIQRRTLIAASAIALPAVGNAQAGRFVVGTYDDKRLWQVKNLTFPRILLYTDTGLLVARESWPKELNSLRSQAGDAFCCISDKPSPPGHLGPPPDCKVVVYGADIDEHFEGLRTAQGTPITRRGLPPHRHLIVEYYASWCAPCKPAREALLALLDSPNGRDVVALVVDFSRRVPGKQGAA